MKKRIFNVLSYVLLCLMVVIALINITPESTEAAATGYTDHPHTWYPSGKNDDCAGCKAKSGYTDCSTCSHTGKVTCTTCSGTGWVLTASYNSSGSVPTNASYGAQSSYYSYAVYTGCTKCSGAGTCYVYYSATNCNGSPVGQLNNSGYKLGSGKVSCTKCGGDGALSTTCQWCNGYGVNYKCTNSQCTLTNSNDNYDNWETEEGYSAVCYTTANTFTIKYDSNGGSGSMANTTVTYGTSTAIRTNSFKKTGHTFSGWTAYRASDGKCFYTNASGSSTGWYVEGSQPSGYTKHIYADGQKVAKTSAVDGDTVTFSAVWTANTFTVEYNSNGGSGSMSSTTVTYGTSTATSANAFTKTGSTFSGWTSYRESDGKCYYQSSDGSSKGWYVEGSQPDGYTKYIYPNKTKLATTSSVDGDTITLSAVWTANTFTIEYDSNGGSGSMSSTTVTYGTSTAIRSNTFTKTGYTFSGWTAYRESDGKCYYTDADGSSTGWYVEGSQPDGYTKFVYADGCKVAKTSAVDGDTVIFYAVWTQNEYLVTYDSNGGDTATSSVISYYGEAVDLSKTSYKDGYIFVGWNTDPNATTALSSFSMPDSDVTLYAIYSIQVSDVANHMYPEYERIVEEEVYFVVWEKGNTSNCKRYPLEYTYDTNIMVYRYTLDNIDISSFISSVTAYEYAILAYDNAGNSNILFSKGSDSVPVSNMYWQTVNHYTYDPVRDKWNLFDTTTQKVAVGNTFTPSYVEAPEGYSTYRIEDAYIVTDEIKEKTSEALYMPNEYVLYFDANGGSVSPESKSVKYNGEYGELPTPTRSGHAFAGWDTTADGSGINVRATDRYLIAEDSTLYAQWTRKSYLARYDYWTNGGTSVSLAEGYYIYENTVDLSVTATKDGYIFVGWNTDPNATTALESYAMPDSDVTLYAIYKKDITLTLVERNSAGTNTQVMRATIYNNTVSTEFVIPTGASWDEWMLLGWTDKTGATEYPITSSGAVYSVTDDATLYALYTSNITLLYDTNGSSVQISAQSGECYYNASGTSQYPTFIIAEAPTLSQSSFVAWKTADETSYLPNESVSFVKDTLLTAAWDKYPEIEAYSRYFTLAQAQTGDITEEELLRKVVGTDFEDGVLVNGVDVVVAGYDAATFMDITSDCQLAVTYIATDSFGNEVTKTVTIQVVDTTVKVSNRVTYYRFISNRFYKDESGLIPASAGGLEETSVWRTNAAYQSLMEAVMSNQKINQVTRTINFYGHEKEYIVQGSGDWEHVEETWYFTQEDIAKSNEFRALYGYGSSKVTNYLEMFMEWFGHCKQ